MLYSLSRKEGWRRYVDAPARQRPEPLTAGQLAALGGQAREDYDEARHDWHANFGILRTPQLAAVHDELELIVAAGRQDPDRVRGAAVIDALPGPGQDHRREQLRPRLRPRPDPPPRPADRPGPRADPGVPGRADLQHHAAHAEPDDLPVLRPSRRRPGQRRPAGQPGGGLRAVVRVPGRDHR